MIQAVADDCLLEIFSFLSQDIMDLCAVGETCKRFRSIAEHVIRKNFCFHMAYQPCITQYSFVWGTSNYKSNNHINVERIFRNFGTCLVQIVVFIYENEEGFVMNLVNKHCRDELKILSINRLSNAEPTVELKPVFQRVQKLHFQFVFIEEGTTFFRNLDSLVDLNVDFVKNCNTILENIFPRLEKFSYCKNKVVIESQMSYSGEQDVQSLEKVLTFIKRHSALKALNMRLSCDQNCWTVIMQTIASNCTKLRELQINMKNSFEYSRFTSVPFKSLQKLTSLKAIRLNNVSFDGFEVFCNLLNLREIVLEDCYLPKDCNQFVFLAQISRFHLMENYWNRSSVMVEIDVVGIIKQLIKLEELVIFGLREMFILNDAMLVQIADLVRERPKVLTLKCNTTRTTVATNLLITKL